MVVGGAAVLVTCTVDPVDLGGLACDAGACLDGYTCDGATNTCVTAGDPCDGDRRRLPCQAGKTCDQGCRTCLDGQWTDCQAGPVCEANTVACDGADLVTCDADGEEAVREDCAVPGCNSPTGTHRCNECVPSTIRCNGLFATACDSTGLEGAPMACDDGDDCTSDNCVDGTGCSNIPDLCPCKKNGDCDDGNVCTDDSCNAPDCVNTFNANFCDDTDMCTLGDICSGGHVHGGHREGLLRRQSLYR